VYDEEMVCWGITEKSILPLENTSDLTLLILHSVRNRLPFMEVVLDTIIELVLNTPDV
jgi:hypothetical protein